jgi:putative phage-type endonuclease
MTTVQGSVEWFQERLGKVTASRVADVLAKTKTGYSASRANYMAQLIAERLTGQPQESYTNAAMQWGIDTEPAAKAAYEFYRDAEVLPVSFLNHPKIKMSGASPDGLVGNGGLVEIKCPNTATHLDTLLNGSIPGKYILQMQWQMACGEREWCDFVSFDPRMPAHMQLFVSRIDRDAVQLAAMEKEIVGFLAEIDGKIEQLNSLYQQKDRAA